MALVIHTCTICSGSGFLRRRACTACLGRGIGAWIGGMFVYFAYRFDASSIRAVTVVALLRRCIVGLLFMFGLVGLAVFVWLFVWQRIPILRLWDNEIDALLLVFWTSLFFDAFLFYRLVQDVHAARNVHRRRFGEDINNVVDETDIFPQVEPQKLVPVVETMTPRSIIALIRAWKLAVRLQHRTVGPEHFLAALLQDAMVGAVFARLEVDHRKFIEGLQRLLARREQGEAQPESDPALRGTILIAYEEAYRERRDHVDVYELLVALAVTPSPAQELFDVFAIDAKKLRDIAHWFHTHALLLTRARKFRGKAAIRPKGTMDRAMTAVATPFLDAYSHDFTQLAKAGALAPCVGREQEIDAILRVLESGKTSVILVGAPGTGKTKVAEGIAERMITEEIPVALQDKRFVSLSIPALLSGASAIGELEERMYRIMHEIARAGNVVLFLDNIQNLVGITTEGGETFDLSQVLADGLEKGIFLAIGTTTPQDYTKYLERNSALATIFQKVDIREMDVDQTILVLEAKVGSIEYRYDVFFSYDALVKAATLSKQYIQDRFLPDKAIKLVEEVAAYVHTRRGKRAIVNGEDVASIVAEKTHVPVTQVTATEKEKLVHLEERLHERIVGQEEAVQLVARALRRARVELRDTKRPIANFLFLGPTGVGKTELAKTVADIYFGSEDAMIRLDMSEYQAGDAVNRLIGAPVGYSGGGEGGYLTEAVRKRPFALVLLDEIEKAHPDILNLFLQVMDDGRLTDTSGRTIDFTNTIIIGTSNAGTQFIQDAVQEGTAIGEIKKQLVNTELRNHFRPEFLNRFDAVVVFRPLTFPEIVQITRLLLKKVGQRLEEKGIHLRVSDGAVEELAHAGFDPLFGARPLRRAIQEHVDDALAKAFLEGQIGRRDVVVLDVGGEIRVEKAAAI